MFNKKKMQIFQLKSRIKELEDIICPFNQHEFIEINSHIDSDCIGNVIESFTCRTLQCCKCKKIVHDNDRIGGFNYKTVDEK